MKTVRHFRKDGGRYRHDEMVDAVRRQVNVEIIDGVERVLFAPGCHVETERTAGALYADFSTGERAYTAHMRPHTKIGWETCVVPEDARGRDCVAVFAMALGNGSPIPQPSGQFDLIVDGEKALSFRVVKHSQTWRGRDGITLFYHVGKLHAARPDHVLYLDPHLKTESFASFGTAFLRIPAKLATPGKPIGLCVVPRNIQAGGFVPSERWFRLDFKPSQAAFRQDLATGINALLAGRTHPKSGDWNVYFGDLHAHSGQHGDGAYGQLWNACGMGSVEDNYLYARDVSNLDFLGLTDHEDDVYDEKGWELRKETAGRYEDPGAFAALLCYEWSNYRFGHRNVYYRDLTGPLVYPWREQDIRKIDADATWDATSPEDLWRALDAWGGRAITVPHHPPFTLHPFSWEYWSEKYDRLVEIYSCWGSSEFAGSELPGRASDRYAGATIRDGLARYRFGLIASSDGHDGRPGNNQSPQLKHHHLYHHLGSGRAAVLADALTRESVFDALHDRRCYATTGEPIVMEFSCGGNVMGSELPAGTAPSFVCRVTGTCSIASMLIVKNGRAAVSFPVGTRDEVHCWTDPDPADGPNYYYLKAVQRDGEMAWSSPIWIG